MNIIQTKKDNGVVEISLNRPEKRNCLSVALMEELLKSLEAASVVVLRGEGKVFCSGLDLDEVKEKGMGVMGQMLAKVLARLKEPDLFSIAAVHGAAVAGGLGIVAACDLAIAQEGTLFGLPEISKGIVPRVIMPHLKQRISRGFIQELTYSGKYVDAKRAYQMGLVIDVVDKDNLLPNTEKLIKSVDQETLKMTKLLINERF